MVFLSPPCSGRGALLLRHEAETSGGARSAHSGDPGVTTAGRQSAYFHLSLWSRFRGAQASEGVTSVWVYVYVYIQLQEKVSEPWISALITNTVWSYGYLSHNSRHTQCI